MSLFSLMNKTIQHDQCSLRTNDSLKVDSLYWIKTIVWSILHDSQTNEQVLFTELKTLKLLTFCVFSQRVVNNAHYTFCQQYFIKKNSTCPVRKAWWQWSDMSFYERCKNTRLVQDKLTLLRPDIYPGQSQRACTYLEKSPIDGANLPPVWSVLGILKPLGNTGFFHTPHW